MFLKTLLLVAISTKLLVADQPCQTPDYEPGECIPLEQCQSLNQHPKNEGDKNHNISAICDYDSYETRVCCHLHSFKTRPMNDVYIKSDLLPSLDQCGPDSSGKIVGGSDTELDEFPWMALLAYRDDEDSPVEYQCGGALINDRYVLTAAHCINSSLVSVRLGEHNLRETKECKDDGYCIDLPVDIPIQDMISFRNFTRKPSVASLHDIALLRLNHTVNFTRTVKPICLPNTVDSITNKRFNDSMMMAGWGRTQEGGHSSPLKRKVDLPVKSCQQDYSCVSCDSSHVCAGGETGKDSCQGDSGGPLMYRDSVSDGKRIQTNWYVFGILGGGNGCGRNQVAWHARVSKYMYWIVNNLKP